MALSRRSFLAASGAGALAFATPLMKIPVGLELYSVRGELAKDLMGTVRAVGQMGYEIVEFYAPYFDWKSEYAKQVRATLDSVNLRCNSTHNHIEAFTGDGLKKAVELNQILGAKYIVLASAEADTLDQWKAVAAKLTQASEKLAQENMRCGYHNHAAEFHLMSGQRPMEVLAANTPKDVMLQFDVGTCLEAGSDPVAWIKQNPGRIRSIHCKDWSSGRGTRVTHTETPDSAGISFGGKSGETGYRVLVGEGEVPWRRVIEAAESVGGVEYYLLEQEGSRFPELETAERCLTNWRKVKAQF